MNTEIKNIPNVNAPVQKNDSPEAPKMAFLLKDIHRVAANADSGTGDTEPPNSQPSQAYAINMDVMYNDTITGKGKRRWYFFQLTEKKKVTAYMSPVADTTVDNDLSLYKLDTATGNLTEVASSQNPAAMYELLSYVAEPGIYLLCVAAFAGETTNQFSFLVRLSDSYDDDEPNDSLLQAKAQPLGQAVTRTLDNSIDQDCSILNVAKEGTYYLTLYGLPDTLNYQLEVLNTSMQVLATLQKNKVTAIKFPVNSYVLRVLAPDGNVDPAVQYKLMVEAQPELDYSVKGNAYSAMLLSDHSYYISTLTHSGSADVEIRVDGKLLDYHSVDLETTRTNTASSSSKCSMTTTADTVLIRMDECTYTGSNEPRAKNLKHAIAMQVNKAIYAEEHSLKSDNLGDMANAKSVRPSTDSSHKTYYTGFWSNVRTMDAYLVWNLDTMQAVDFSNPNWYHGSPSIAGYKPYGTPENIVIDGTKTLLE